MSDEVVLSLTPQEVDLLEVLLQREVERSGINITNWERESRQRSANILLKLQQNQLRNYKE